jgi:hypothetical protein
MGNEGEWSNSHSHSEFGSAGFIDRTTEYTRNAVMGNATIPKLTLSVGWDSYSFSMSNITQNQNGGGHNVEVKSDPINGMTTTTSTTTVSPTKKVSFGVQGKNRDTTITINETTENPTFGTKETKSTGIRQTASWINDRWLMNYNQDYSDITRTEFSFTEETRWHQIIIARLILSYTGDPPTGIEAEQQSVPTTFALNQNYPNPFNPSTVISYSVPTATFTTLTITDVLGRKITTLVDGERQPGTYTHTWNAAGLPSGVYFLHMKAGGFVQTKKLSLAK